MAVEGERPPGPRQRLSCGPSLTLRCPIPPPPSSDHLKTEEELAKEKQILNEMLEVVEQRNDLVALLEEQRLQEKEEDKDLEAVMLSKGLGLNWV